MKSRNSQSSTVEHLLERMPPEIAATFSFRQCQALEGALTPRRHPVNIRLSVPMGWSCIYLVVLAGTETRSVARRRVEAVQHPLWTPRNLLVIVGTTAVGILALLAIVQISTLKLSSVLNPEAAPAVIPFKADQASCEQSGRVWQNEACLDFDHDPTF